MGEFPLPQPIFVISDGTGDTAEKVVRAALHQFETYLVDVRTYGNVTSPDQIERYMRIAAREKALVVTTLVRSDMREAARRCAAEHRIRTVDILAGLLNTLSSFLGAQPEGVPGRMHQADDEYFRRVEAVEFTVKADDGKEPRMLRQADLVLVGVSRTSKTPLSVFLAHKGYRVSNVPVVLERPLPGELDAIDQRRIYALTIDPEALRDIRRQRLKTMAMPAQTNYGDMDYILAELEWAEHLFRQRPAWPVVDVTRKAVEETAATILKLMLERGLTRDRGEAGQL
jgi:hypothetical protein